MRSIRRILIFLSLTLALCIPVFGQDDPKETARQYMEVAETMITETKAIDDARDLMVTAADLDTTFIKANYQAGQLHLQTIGKEHAVKYLLRVFRQEPTYRFDIEYWIGKSYQYGLEFDKAIRFYTLYKEKLLAKSNYQGRDKVDMATVDRSLYECANGKEFVSRPGNFSIVNIGREINSEFEDYAPVFSEQEDEIVFTSRRRDGNLNENVADDNKPFEDIFTARRKGGSWERAKNIGAPVNTASHDSNLALSADGNTLFMYKDDNGGDIYYSERDANGVWGPPIPLPGIINSSYEEKSITISKDEKTLYFTSNRPGGYGGTDIYRATLDTKNNWSNVKNLGPVINTDLDEEGPFIDYDGVTLYFSSKGHKGMGDHDIYKSVYDPKKNSWSEPENLGYPINTPDDDVFFVSSTDGKRAYYSSVREDGIGYTDIYLITIPEGLKKTEPVVTQELPKEEPVVAKTEPVVVTPEPINTPKEEPKVEPVKTEPKQEPKVESKQTPKPEPKKEVVPLQYIVSVIDAETKAPLDAKVRLQGLRDNVIVPSSERGEGTYEFAIASTSAKDYRLSVERDGYIFHNQNVKLQGAGTEPKSVTRKIEMRKLVVGATSILRNIYFDFDKATFKDESYNELNKLERMMKANQNIKVEIAGHTDIVGTKAYNTFLSRKRAEAVKDFLTSRGIDARRVKAVGYGATRPLASNDDEREGRELNRRVEFMVLEN